MRHAIRRLEEELRQLVAAWQGLRVSVVLNDTLRSTMERQTAAEIRDVHEALHVLRHAARQPSKITEATERVVNHILGTKGQDS